ncbi:hypothetical protein SAMN05414139_10502 [Burkholderia sp. D7]|nr:hypothetical protein SAMN05414139_10502 [Burkholderia sp. D7]
MGGRARRAGVKALWDGPRKPTDATLKSLSMGALNTAVNVASQGRRFFQTCYCGDPVPEKAM